jgi:hypothetical protein
MIETRCHCGSVKLALKGEPVIQLYCHCDDCQAAHGAAYVAAAIYPAGSVEIMQGATKTMAIRETPRLRCEDCGQHLFSELARVNMRSLNAFLLPKGAFRPQFHVQCRHAVLPVVDDLPHYQGFPAAFGGTERFVDW